MEKKTMGSFLAALRKANGLTQQDIADRLNVSNKAVSRWERDECMPDITLIPALAELLGVSCDELLRGERMRPKESAAVTDAFSDASAGETGKTGCEGTEGTAPERERSDPRTAKQVKAVIRRTLSAFRTRCWISIGLSAIGYILMLGITFGFYRRIVGFAVMSLFAVAAFVTAVIALNGAREAKEDNELYGLAPEALRERFDRTLGRFSLTAFVFAAGAVLLSLPQLFVRSVYTHAILPANDYFPAAFLIAASAAVFSLLVSPYYSSRVTGSMDRTEWNDRLILDLYQFGALAAGAVPVVCSALVNEPAWSDRFGFLTLGVLLLNPVFFAVLYPNMKKRGSDVLLPGLRNIALTVPARWLLSKIHVVRSFDAAGKPIGHDIWVSDVTAPLLLLLALFAAEWALRYFRKKK